MYRLCHLLGLNMLQSGLHKQHMKDLFVELCLTVPVRLSSLLPYLPMLMDPLVSALNGSQTLVSQGLRTLELCVDNLQPDFLYDHIQPVRAELMQVKLLTFHLRPDWGLMDDLNVFLNAFLHRRCGERFVTLRRPSPMLLTGYWASLEEVTGRCWRSRRSCSMWWPRFKAPASRQSSQTAKPPFSFPWKRWYFNHPHTSRILLCCQCMIYAAPSRTA